MLQADNIQKDNAKVRKKTNQMLVTILKIYCHIEKYVQK